jgi:hypothetical protein
MQFLKNFLRNLALLFAIGLVLFLVSPSMMSQVFQLYGALFGPLAIIILAVIALPRKQKGHRN